jgi:SAM-dependent methyltransferase
MSQIQSNAAQNKYWNETGGPRWVAMQEDLDAELRPFGEAAQSALGLPAGARVLDVGCGAGATSLMLVEQVHPGEVLGVDISAPLLARARDRAVGVERVRFELADAQTFPFEPESFDAVFSRFGVMFFEEPVAAFRNLRRALRPGGRLGFVCWRALSENPSFSLPLQAALPFLTERLEPAKPGEPGPFALASREHLANVLEGAGFEEIVIEAHDTKMIFAGRRDLDGAVERAFHLGPLGRLREPLEPAVREQVRSAVRAAFEPHHGASGVLLPAATWLVTARNG